MKIGVISDIHGNLRALEVILRAFQLHSVERIICIGDMIGYFHQSIDVLDRLMKINVECLFGNHEAYLLGHLKCSRENWQIYFLDQVKKNISRKRLNWLSKLPESLEINLNDKYLSFFHGSPWKPLEEYIYPDSNKFDDFATLRWEWIFLGHTHYPMLKHIGNVNIINPGSCGLPRDGDLRASAAIFDSDKEKIFFIKESYDIQLTIKEALLAGVSSDVIQKFKDKHLLLIHNNNPKV
ncbi:MAG: metallophosphatase family protein [Nanoarchaeota archaeon]|nr:metallophosphatase family protein [Nanoarchaeota archaeon]